MMRVLAWSTVDESTTMLSSRHRVDGWRSTRPLSTNAPPQAVRRISRLEPGAAIRPHTGPTNRRWTLHLGLVVDACVEINHGAPDTSSLRNFSAMERPPWLSAARNWHRHGRAGAASMAWRTMR